MPAAEAEDPPLMCAKVWVSGAANVPLGRCFPSDYATHCEVLKFGNDDPVTVGVAVCVPIPTRD
ncbi:MAG TPA: hypothetical protein VNA20_04675 [Frankiaceae bacterium]|nr:hypothetical protein [Frankiaceae bacterium]